MMTTRGKAGKIQKKIKGKALSEALPGPSNKRARKPRPDNRARKPSPNKRETEDHENVERHLDVISLEMYTKQRELCMEKVRKTLKLRADSEKTLHKSDRTGKKMVWKLLTDRIESLLEKYDVWENLINSVNGTQARNSANDTQAQGSANDTGEEYTFADLLSSDSEAYSSD